MKLISLPVMFLLLTGCSSHASKQDQLSAAANQSTPEAANVLNGAAENGMNEQAALNEAAQAQAQTTSTRAPQRYQARPNTPQNPNPPKAGEPPQKTPVGNGD